MDRIIRHKWFSPLVALLFALLLFWNANSEKKVLKGEAVPSISAVADKVPIQLLFDDKKYYISGFDPTTTVYLKSNNKVLLDGETNELTRNFKVQADLTNLEEGVHDVPLEVKGLNSAVNAVLGDQSINVTIEKRATKEFEVVPELNDTLLKQGYTLDSITADPEKVTVTAGESTIHKIDKVAAVLSDVRDLSENMTREVDLVALDEQANALGVIIAPAAVKVQVKVTAPSKSVPLEIKQSGSIAEGIKEFKFKPEMENIVIYGSRTTIDAIDKLELVIDTSGIEKRELESYSITKPEGVELDPAIVQVEVTPVKKDKEEK